MTSRDLYNFRSLANSTCYVHRLKLFFPVDVIVDVFE